MVCYDQSYLSTSQSLEVERGSSVIHLENKCMVTSKYYVIPPFFMNTSSFNISRRMLEFNFDNLTRLGWSSETIGFQESLVDKNFSYQSSLMNKLEAYERHLEYLKPVSQYDHNDFKLKSYLSIGIVAVIIFVIILISYIYFSKRVGKVELRPKSVTLQELKDLYNEFSH